MDFTNVHTLIDVGEKDTCGELLSYLLHLQEFPLDILIVFTGSDESLTPDAQAYWVNELESNILQNVNSSVHYTTWKEYVVNTNYLTCLLGDNVLGDIINEIRY